MTRHHLTEATREVLRAELDTALTTAFTPIAERQEAARLCVDCWLKAVIRVLIECLVKHIARLVVTNGQVDGEQIAMVIEIFEAALNGALAAAHAEDAAVDRVH